MSQSSTSFSLFTSLRYDPLLLTSAENSSAVVSFTSPSPFYMLRFHRDRMLEAAQHFEWTSVAESLSNGTELEQALLQEVTSWQETNSSPDAPLKVRILYNKSGAMQVECTPTPPTPLSALYPLTLDLPPAPAPAPAPKPFTPSPLTGGALTLGPTDTLPSSTSTTTTTTAQPPPWQITLDTHPTPATAHTTHKTTHRPHYDAARQRSKPAASGPGSASPGPAAVHEVLLWAACDEITEGSFTSPYFYHGGRWVTPPVGVPDCVDRASEDAGAGAGTAGAGSPTTTAATTADGSAEPTPTPSTATDEGELRTPFAGRWGHSLRSAKATSPIIRGGQRGTTRRWALGKGLCMEEPVHRGSVGVGERVWVSNGVRGFCVGVVVGREGDGEGEGDALK